MWKWVERLVKTVGKLVAPPPTPKKRPTKRPTKKTPAKRPAKKTSSRPTKKAVKKPVAQRRARPIQRTQRRQVKPRPRRFTFDQDLTRSDFPSDEAYFEFRVREGMQGHEYGPPDDEVIEWAIALIQNYRWGDLESWLDWTFDEMRDFWDWWRDWYANYGMAA